MALTEDAATKRQSLAEYAEDRLRSVASERGLDWDRMSEEQREEFIDDLIHEDRDCGR